MKKKDSTLRSEVTSETPQRTHATGAAKCAKGVVQDELWKKKVATSFSGKIKKMVELDSSPTL